jgi:hypothetical protein
MEKIILENDSEPSTVTRTQLISHEGADALIQAAAEVSDEIAVKVYDPEVPEERDEFAKLAAADDRRMAGTVMYGYDIHGKSIEIEHPVRTPEQIDKQQIQYAIKQKLALFAITAPYGRNMGDLYKRADEISNPSNS